ncbi:hypothetical protein [Rhodoferax sp. WC2427]|uniref:hypothetical protein n=1 Tax=Rhodoferax sp. WC2427 TaxID=3234144 RepID=UPI0034663511
MSTAAKLVLAFALFVAGLATGIKYHAGLIAQRDMAAASARRADTIRQHQYSDGAGGEHAAVVAQLSNQLGNAREKIATLSGRECLDPGTVGVLNAIGGEPVRAAASEPAGTPTAASAGGGLRFSTDRDTARAIAVCRARYAEAVSQLDQILDIEAARHGGPE